MSYFDQNSQVNLINNHAHKKPITIAPDLFKVISIAQNLSQMSDGTFDITLHRSQNNSNYEDIQLLENSQIYFKKPLKIDLAGIAKGYSVDEAAKVIELSGIKNYTINAGGDLKVGDIDQDINIRSPKNPERIIHQVTIKNQSLATSSGSFSQKKNLFKTIYPLFNKNHKPSTYNNESTTIITKNCIYADALTKITAILKEDSKDILSQLQAKAILVTHSQQLKFINP